MASIPQKFTISVSNAAISSKQVALNFNRAAENAVKALNALGSTSKSNKVSKIGKNAFRISAIKIQIDDLDAEAADDLLLKLQLAYSDLAGKTVLTIDDQDEILTLAARISQVDGTNTVAENVPDKIRDQGILYLDGKDFVDAFICEPEFYLNCVNSGQDAIEEWHITLYGNYVNLTNISSYRNKTGML
jgi:hypothetical protein